MGKIRKLAEAPDAWFRRPYRGAMYCLVVGSVGLVLTLSGERVDWFMPPILIVGGLIAFVDDFHKRRSTPTASPEE